MMTTVLHAAFAILTLAITLGMVRLLRGPTVIDRIMAFDLITTSAVGMIVLLSVRWKTAMYVELILIFSLLGFFSTVAFVHYLSRTQDLDQPSQPKTAGGNPPPPAPAPAPDHG